MSVAAAPSDDSQIVDVATALHLLRHGDISEQGVIPWSSNYALLVSLKHTNLEMLAIYKPQRGERPLWDFPVGSLYLREIAAYVLSEALGWGLVPPTVLRDGPYGPGALQIFIDNDPETHYFNIYPRHTEEFRRIALFDVIVNNADRKAGHCLLDAADHIWSIDHGVCFHVEHKLRTVIWDFAGAPIPLAMLDDLRALAEQVLPARPLTETLISLLSPSEVDALRQRLQALIEDGHFPVPDPKRRNHPWPPI